MGPGAHPSSCTMGTWSFPRIKSGRGVTLTIHLLLVPLSRKRAIPLPPYGPYGLNSAQCLYNGALYLYLYLYSPHVLYGLYRASVPVQRCTLPLPIPLITPCAVRPVQSLSACTTAHFTFTYTSTSLCAVRPVQSLSACTTVHFIFTCTSTLPMCCTACTEPQCLYNGALYLYLYIYSPYEPYGLYSVSVPVQRCILPLIYLVLFLEFAEFPWKLTGGSHVDMIMWEPWVNWQNGCPLWTRR